MKEIGDAFKEARGAIGISKEEVMKDLGLTESQLDNLEDGNINAFKDVFFLKETIKKYTKYLNLDEDEIMEKFNDFIFGFTSRIPIDDILEQTKEINIQEIKNKENKIVSPYTSPIKKKGKTKYIVLFTLSVIIMIVLTILIIKYFSVKDVNNVMIWRDLR